MRDSLLVLALCVVFVALSRANILDVPSLLDRFWAGFQLVPYSGVEQAVSHLGTLPPNAVVHYGSLLAGYLLQLVTSSYAILLVAVVAAVKLFRFLFIPVSLIRHLGDVGYVNIRGETKKGAARICEKNRKPGDLPPVYPNGWFHLCYSKDIAKGTVKYVQQLGEHFAVFRGDSGQVHVLDAYCPHMGANLAIGGRVQGDCLDCPFHGWQFDGADGKCVNIPYAKKVPDFAKTKSWACLERNREVYVWYNAEGEEPWWYPEEIEELSEDGEWSFKGLSVHYINCHIEEVPENGADLAHLWHLHVPFVGVGADLRYIFTRWLHIKHYWTATWEQLEEPNSHIGRLSLEHELQFFNWTVPFTKLVVRADQIGPGIVYLKWKSSMGRGAFIQSLTPEEPLLQRMTNVVYCSKWIPAFMGTFFLKGEVVQIERDVMIWNNKTWKAKPLLVKEDNLVAKHRRWYSQFYSKNSPVITAKKDPRFDW